jgi:hypothetical protein
MANSVQRTTDVYGRTVYGNSVHRDFYPLRWIPGLLLLVATYGRVPNIFMIIGISVYGALFFHNQVFMMPRDTVPRHLRKKKHGTRPASDRSRAPRSTR